MLIVSETELVPGKCLVVRGSHTLGQLPIKEAAKVTGLRPPERYTNGSDKKLGPFKILDVSAFGVTLEHWADVQAKDVLYFEAVHVPKECQCGKQLE